MRKIYLVILLFVSSSAIVMAQKKTKQLYPDLVKPKFDVKGFLNRSTAGCDTINVPIPDEWQSAIYTLGARGGFLTGTNKYEDKEKAAYFDASASSNTYLIKAFILFGVANSNKPANLTKVVPIKLYETDLNSEPTNVIATVNKTLGQLKADVDAGFFTEVVFPTGTQLPASKEFYISVDMSNLVWDSTSAVTEKDSIAIYSTADGDLAGATSYDGWFYEKWSDNSWNSGYDAWGGLDVNLWIFPVISSTTTCTSLPVTLSGFGGERQGANNVLKWTTASEANNKGFELERSIDGINFSSLAFVQTKAGSGNSSLSNSYLYTDNKPFKGNSYYRLKQVDKDGRFTFSSIVLIKGGVSTTVQLSSVYPNPAKSVITIVLNTPAKTMVNFVVTDLAGKTLMQQSSEMKAGDNTVPINIAKLSAGSYIIKATCETGCELAISRFIKQ